MTHDLVDEFARAVTNVGGTCTLAAAPKEAADVVRRLLLAAARVGVSDAPLAQEIWALSLARREPNYSADDDLFALDAGITGIQWGIAETGTLVLDSGRERNRLLSLVPPVHIALLRAADIRPTLTAVLTEARSALGSALTFITGPSRTSDIELIPVIGVHGPQHLHVIILS